MGQEDIVRVIDLFAQAAARAKKAGFDGVQIHAAHGFFLSRTLSPLYNKRQDRYGGSPENRARILTEIIDAVREKTGDFHISMKINCDDFQAGGLSASDSREICKQAELHGISSIEVSGSGASRSGVKATVNEGYFQTYATELQKTIDVPVISVGGYRSAEYISRILNETPLEYVSLSRPPSGNQTFQIDGKMETLLRLPVFPATHAAIRKGIDVFLDYKVNGEISWKAFGTGKSAVLVQKV